jgi:hypothetical protein
MEFLPLILAIGVIYLVLRKAFKSLFSLDAGATRKTKIPENVFEWPDTGKFDCDIVGESHYQFAIKQLAGSNNEYVEDKEYRAFLIPEDDNPHDNKAVRIDINSSTVGYLSRDNARTFRRRLGAKKLTGQITSCKAVVTGGQPWEGNTSYYGVCLNIKDFDW